uniref:Nodal-related 1 n=1 Tax=Callorhinchus milii TaxID=7868 RepID=A0A4W3I136_CALMI
MAGGQRLPGLSPLIVPLLLLVVATTRADRGAGVAPAARGPLAPARGPPRVARGPPSVAGWILRQRLPLQPRYPAYMMRLYRAATGGGDVPRQHRTAVRGADKILSLEAASWAYRGDRWVIHFDLSSISGQDSVQFAELRLHLSQIPVGTNATITIYHSRGRECAGNQSCQDRFLLGSFTADPSTTESSWKVFNVTGLLDVWTGLEPIENAQVSRPHRHIEARDHEAGEEHLKVIREKLVMMVVFCKRNSSEGLGAPTLLRTVESSKFRTSGKGNEDASGKRHKRNKKERLAEGNSTSSQAAGQSLCRRMDMEVNFDHIGWGEWIIYPKTFNAYRCGGLCPSPVDEVFMPTNHAYMQSLLQSFHPERVPCTACVPVRLSSLSMLYYRDSEVVLSHHKDMIVEECGCR